MTDERRPRPSERSIWSTIRRDPDDGAIGAVWSGLTVDLDATPQKSRRIVDWPWSSGMPGVPRIWPRVPGPAIAVLAVVAMLAATMVIGVIATAHRLPPPFGLAKPGLIAFNDGGDIFVANADGTGRRAVTSGPADDVQPTWSPDGTMIAFWSLNPGETFASLSVIDADGTHPRAVATKDLRVDVSGTRTLDPYDIVWSPDDRSLAFTGGTSYHEQVVVASVDGTGSAAVGDPGFDSQTPTWSPDGTKIAFRGGRADSDRGVYVMNADGSDLRRVTLEVDDSWGNTYSYFMPAWSPDGARIAFSRKAPDVRHPSGVWGVQQVWVVDAGGGNERVLSDDQAVNDYPAWAPDGSRIAYRRSLDGEAATTVVVKPDGSDPITLAGSGVGIPRWSPDGSAIVSNAAAETGSGVDIVVSSTDSGAALRFPATATDAPTALGNGDVSWQRLAP